MRCPQRDDVTVIDDGDAIAQALRFIHVVSRQDDRPAGSPEFLDESPELPPRLRVEPGRRLVQEKKLRISHHRACDRQPLFLAAGKRTDPRIVLFAELHEVYHVVDLAAPLVEAPKEADSLRN
jgi:hypothetical protein